MRTLFLTQDFPPPIRGGSYVLFHSLYRHWPQDELVVMTAPSSPNDGIPRVMRDYILPTHSRASWSRKGSMLLRWVVDGLRLFQQQPFDVIHCGQLFSAGLAALALSRFTRRPLLQWALGEDMSILDSLTGLHRFRTWASELVLRHATHIVTISTPSLALAQQRGVSQARIRVIRPGFDAEQFACGADGAGMRAELGLGAHPVILTVGRLTPRKGHDMVVRALPHIAAVVPTVRYLIAGASESREGAEIEALVDELGVRQYVHFLGPIAPDRLPSLYAAADLFVMPNRTLPNGDTEGFGIVFLEANALSKPVIGGRAGGALDAVADGESGLLVDGNDPSAIASAAIRLLQNPALAQQLGAQGRARLATWPSWQESSHQLYQLSQQLVSKS